MCWGQACLELRVYFRPLVVKNAEVHSIAHAASPGEEMAAKSSLFFRANAQDRVARLLIQRIRFQFQANALPDFKRVAEHEVFRFCVDCGTLPRRSDPGGSDFDAAVHAIDIHEACTAYSPSGLALDRGEDDGLSTFLFIERFIYQLAKVFSGSDGIGNPAEYIFEIVPGDIPEQFRMLKADGFKANDRALKGHRARDLERSRWEQVGHDYE